jgi:hypothetical protein
MAAISLYNPSDDPLLYVIDNETIFEVATFMNMHAVIINIFKEGSLITAIIRG